MKLVLGLPSRWFTLTLKNRKTEQVVVRAGLHLHVGLKSSVRESHLLIIETAAAILNGGGHRLQPRYANRELERTGSEVEKVWKQRRLFL